MSEQPELSDREANEFLESLFPNRVEGRDVWDELGIRAWPKCAWFRMFHPRAEDVLRDMQTSHASDESWMRSRVPHPPSIEVAQAYVDGLPQRPVREFRLLVGVCLWCVFSDNNDVITTDGRAVRLGTWRAGAGTIADFLNSNAPPPESPFDYMDFYMAQGLTAWGSVVDLVPVCAMIFRRIKALGGDWDFCCTHFAAEPEVEAYRRVFGREPVGLS